MKKEVAIDLTWVRHKKVGGTESNVRNLLNGLAELDDDKYKFLLLVTNDNAESFREYSDYRCFELINVGINSASQIKRVLWQNLHMGNLLRRRKIGIFLEPVYGLPFIGMRGIKAYTIIHDLQAAHYPEYFSKGRVLWMKASWRNAVKKSHKVIAISDFVRDDIIAHYHCPKEKVKTIYNSINIDKSDCAPDNELGRFGVESGEYYYTVSSMFPHKNLKTLLYAMGKLKGSDAYKKLVISGISAGSMRAELEEIIKTEQIDGQVIFTPFISNPERNLLYKHCRAFLFPSIFEGFGMPPVEAMAYGMPVLTTRKTSLPEVTAGLCNYVDDPMDANEWAARLKKALNIPTCGELDALLRTYNCAAVAQQYTALFE